MLTYNQVVEYIKLNDLDPDVCIIASRYQTSLQLDLKLIDFIVNFTFLISRESGILSQSIAFFNRTTNEIRNFGIVRVDDFFCDDKCFYFDLSYSNYEKGERLYHSDWVLFQEDWIVRQLRDKKIDLII